MRIVVGRILKCENCKVVVELDASDKLTEQKITEFHFTESDDVLGDHDDELMVLTVNCLSCEAPIIVEEISRECLW